MKLNDNATVKLLSKENPHRAGSKDHKKWSVLNAAGKTRPKGISVATAVAKGSERSYIRYAAERGLLKVTPAKKSATRGRK